MKTKFLALLLSLLCMFSATGAFAQTDKPYSALEDDSAQMIYQYFLGEGEHLQYDFTLLPGDVGHFLAHDRNNGSFRACLNFSFRDNLLAVNE